MMCLLWESLLKISKDTTFLQIKCLSINIKKIYTCWLHKRSLALKMDLLISDQKRVSLAQPVDNSNLDFYRQKNNKRIYSHKDLQWIHWVLED